MCSLLYAEAPTKETLSIPYCPHCLHKDSIEILLFNLINDLYVMSMPLIDPFFFDIILNSNSGPLLEMAMVSACVHDAPLL